MTETQKIELRRSKIRERLAAIAKLSGDEYSDEVKAEERALQDEFQGLEVRHRSALIAESEELEQRRSEAGDGLDAEARERIELRSKASLSKYLQAFARGRVVDGPRRSCAPRPVSPASRSSCGTCRRLSGATATAPSIAR